MKIIHLVNTDEGGAGRATIRISKSINELCDNNTSKILVARRTKKINTISSLEVKKINKLQRMINSQINKISIKKYKTSSLFSNSKLGFSIINNPLIRECDIIHLHWINDALLSYNELERLKKIGKPIVWTLHDMWPFTGGCHYDDECEKYKKICGECRVLNSHKRKDLSTKIQNKKKYIYSKMNITIVGCSNWITDCAKESTLFKDKECLNIPNCIDIKRYKPINREMAKNILNINTDKKIILFGAMSATDDKRKGFKYLLEAIKKLDKNKYTCVIFGNDSEDNEIQKYMDTIYVGNIEDDYSLALLYSCADVFVAPSIQENLANTVMESLSCGTPVVAFDIGGMPDMIKHKINGYLAESFNHESLTRGIEYCIKNTEVLGNEARKYVENNFTYEIIGKKYIDIYKRLIIKQENR